MGMRNADLSSESQHPMNELPSLVLATRSKEQSITFAAFQTPETPLPSTISVGAQVSLRSDTVTILVRITHLAAQELSGEVVGFERWDGAQFGDLYAGCPITFREDNVFACIT